MEKIFGKGSENSPVRLGGVDGFLEEICLWLDVADAELSNINMLWVDLGARMNRGELTLDRLGSDVLNYATLSSQNEDVDEAYAIMMLEVAQTVYNASLAAGARVIQPTLLDFLS